MRTTRLVCLAAAAALAVWVNGTGSAAASVTHTVRRGETLTSVAAIDGLSVDQLAAANGLSPSAELIAGSSLVIPPQGGSSLPAAPAASVSRRSPAIAPAVAGAGGDYLVQPGDTLSGIAAAYGTTPAALAAANGLSVNGLLLAGSTLTVSGAPSALSATSATSAVTATSVPSAAAIPTDESVSAADIGAIAQASGVPASLAEAVAYQESGFNNAMVSRTGATGVMQIEPGTWEDLARLDGLHLSADSATDNVRGGVAILQGLLAQTGGDEAEAAAAYYQGLASVRAHGMYPSTRRYVRDVLALEGRFGG